jgi:TatD DNase family protein
MNLIDTHCHLTFESLFNRIDNVLQRSLTAGVNYCITIGTDTEQNRRVISIIDKYENLYGAIGMHPHYASDISSADIEEIKTLVKHKKIVAIGETGLDFHYNLSKKDAQKQLFETLLQISVESQLPVIIHCRDAFDETIEIIDKFKNTLKNVVFHCFSGTISDAQVILSKGFHISFTGVVTFKNAEQTRKVAELVPLEKMMIETDSPYMSPEPMRKQKINEPALLIHTAAKIAELKKISLEEFADSVTKTTKDFFNI